MSDELLETMALMTAGERAVDERLVMRRQHAFHHIDPVKLLRCVGLAGTDQRQLGNWAAAEIRYLRGEMSKPEEISQPYARELARQVEELEKENAALREALKPFAVEVECLRAQNIEAPPERFLMFASSGGGTFLGLSMSAIYDAAAAMSSPDEAR